MFAHMYIRIYDNLQASAIEAIGMTLGSHVPVPAWHILFPQVATSIPVSYLLILFTAPV